MVKFELIYKKRPINAKFDFNARMVYPFVVKARWSDFSDHERASMASDERNLFKGVDARAANSGKVRDESTRELNAFIGMLSEYAVVKYLRDTFPKDDIQHPEVITTRNQIDITWQRESVLATVEVRASFVRNGIDFFLFAYDKFHKQSYFDIIGPYMQPDYKKEPEELKDIFVRVVFEGDSKKLTKQDLIDNNVPFFITGGQTKSEFRRVNKIKKLSVGESDQPGQYSILPVEYTVGLPLLMDKHVSEQNK